MQLLSQMEHAKKLPSENIFIHLSQSTADETKEIMRIFTGYKNERQC